MANLYPLLVHLMMKLPNLLTASMAELIPVTIIPKHYPIMIVL